MTDRPIIFSGQMVRAILREIKNPGTGKTQTRRLAWTKHEKVIGISSEQMEDYELRGIDYREIAPANWIISHPSRWQFAKPGDRMYVREAWRTLHSQDILSPRLLAPERFKITYEADPENRNSLWAFGRLRAAMHMPRWASRLTLIVKSVKVERLQDISAEDAIREGIEYRDGCYGTWNEDDTLRCGGSPDPIEAFRCLWINIHGNGSWEENPDVVAISFRPFAKNIDDLEARGLNDCDSTSPT